MGRPSKFQSREQALINELREALGEARTLEDVYEAISNALLKLCEADHLAVGGAHPDGTVGLQWKTETVHSLLKDYEDWVKEDFVFHATMNQPNLVLSDTEMLRGLPLVETETYRRSQGAGLKLKRVLASLMVDEQKLMGGVALYRESPRPFSVRAQWLLQQILPSISRAVDRLQEEYVLRFERDLLKAVAMSETPVLVLNSLGRLVVDAGEAIPLVARWFAPLDILQGVPKAWTERIKAMSSSFDVAADPRMRTLTLERGPDRLDVTFTQSSVVWGGRKVWQVRMHERVHWLRPDWKEKLTTQELRVADCLHEGLANKEIASQFRCSVETVKVHIKSIFEKTGVHSRGEFVARGRRA
jgi:DNA-binding CsgD family transcriptional regulator